jgi:hypothetical protein
MPPAVYTQIGSAVQDASRSRKLQLLGILSGFAAGAWLGAAEAPTKLVSIGISPMVISLIMVMGASCRMPLGRGQHADDFRHS